MEFLSKNLEETKEIAVKFASGLKSQKKATIVGLYGELGSGKTTFMKYFAKALGVKEEIKSPTFVLMKFFHLTPRYASPECSLTFQGEGLHAVRGEDFNKLIHIDAYRIEKAEEMLNLGWNEIIADPRNLICIEWPEKIADIMPRHIMLKFEHVVGIANTEDPERSEWKGETERKISINNL
jgi:tRNA threonylcarbamoyladenosine biosynthesis protein TsaE